MECAHKQYQVGFTLVEIAIVMMIIGLLIGGTLGGMQLVKNAKISSAVRDIKAAQASAFTFRDIYGRLPGDLRNPSSRLPNCLATPCSNSGDGNRQIGDDNTHPPNATSGTTDERFVFWQHLLAAGLIVYVKPVNDISFGQGQPNIGFDGLRIVWGRWSLGDGIGIPWHYFISTISNGNPHASSNMSGTVGEAIDRKIDDGMPNTGRMGAAWGCNSTGTGSADATYLSTRKQNCTLIYKSGF